MSMIQQPLGQIENGVVIEYALKHCRPFCKTKLQLESRIAQAFRDGFAYAQTLDSHKEPQANRLLWLQRIDAVTKLINAAGQSHEAIARSLSVLEGSPKF